MEPIEKKLGELPPEFKKEVEDFVDFLLKKVKRKSTRKPKLDWRGALRDLRDQYSSVELQHKILEWWGD